MARGTGNCKDASASPRGTTIWTPTLLRHVALEAGYELATWDTHRTDEMGKSVLSYRFTQNGVTLFEGEDYHVAPSHAVDSDEALRALLGFLTLRPGDTDDEYFARYTPEQTAFAAGDAEMLQLYADESEPEPFSEIEAAEPLLAPAPFQAIKEGDVVESGPWEGFEIVSVYSREQAIADGELVDVSEQARETGYKAPVALSARLFALVEPTKEEADRGQDLRGRLHDVLMMGLMYQAAAKARRGDEGHFPCIFALAGRPGIRGGQKTFDLKIVPAQSADGQFAFSVFVGDED